MHPRCIPEAVYRDATRLISWYKLLILLETTPRTIDPQLRRLRCKPRKSQCFARCRSECFPSLGVLGNIQGTKGAFGLATPARFERATCRLEGGCSIQLSYGAPCGCYHKPPPCRLWQMRCSRYSATFKSRNEPAAQSLRGWRVFGMGAPFPLAPLLLVLPTPLAVSAERRPYPASHVSPMSSTNQPTVQPATINRISRSELLGVLVRCSVDDMA